MKIYCTSKNSGPSMRSYSVYMKYIGTDLEKALEQVGSMARYERDLNEFPVAFEDLYSALPKEIDWGFEKFYAADGWWVSVVSFELEEN